MSVSVSATRHRRLQSGQCGECGVECQTVSCDSCKRKACDRKKRLRLRRRMDGLCVDCGAVEPCYPLSRCLACRDDHLRRDAESEHGRKYRKQRREGRKAAGLCAVCGRQPHLPEMLKCLACKVRIGLRERQRREGMV